MPDRHPDRLPEISEPLWPDRLEAEHLYGPCPSCFANPTGICPQFQTGIKGLANLEHRPIFGSPHRDLVALKQFRDAPLFWADRYHRDARQYRLDQAEGVGRRQRSGIEVGAAATEVLPHLVIADRADATSELLRPRTGRLPGQALPRRQPEAVAGRIGALDHVLGDVADHRIVAVPPAEIRRE